MSNLHLLRQIATASPADDNSAEPPAILASMRTLMYALLALVVALPFAKPADAQVVLDIGHHHHRHYHHHHHHHYYHRY